MSQYSLTEKQDGTIEFWTDDKELRLRVSQNIADTADAISYRRLIKRASEIPLPEPYREDGE